LGITIFLLIVMDSWYIHQIIKKTHPTPYISPHAGIVEIKFIHLRTYGIPARAENKRLGCGGPPEGEIAQEGHDLTYRC